MARRSKAADPTGPFEPYGIGTGPGSGLSPSDISAAYGIDTAYSGTGQTLAVFALDGFRAEDVAFYNSHFFPGLPAVPVETVLVDGATGAPGAMAREVTLDIELQIALAPKASRILVYEGPQTATGVLDTYNKIATENRARCISTSFGAAEGLLDDATRNAENAIFRQMAAQGQSLFAASGDSGAYADPTHPGQRAVSDPAAQPYVTGVGGTRLTTAGPGGVWQAETSYNTGTNAGGGGSSAFWNRPAYQDKVVDTWAYMATKGDPIMRSVPDVALNADPRSGYAVYCDGAWSVTGGTSCAAPLWAAWAALVNQKRAALSDPPLGFANPTLYTVAQDSAAASAFHDVEDASTNFYYPAVDGYDLTTGWGSMDGASLRDAAAHGRVLWVNLHADQGPLDGSSASHGFWTFTDALKAALPGDEVWAVAGDYPMQAESNSTITLKEGVSLYGGFAGTETRREQRRPDANRVLLQGHANSVITAIDGITPATVVDGFNITGGGGVFHGGGITCERSSPTISHNDIWGNASNGPGGGIYASDASPVITDNLIDSNATYPSDFGSLNGGGIALYGGAPIVLLNGVWGNVADMGGGIFCSGSAAVIANNVIAQNRAASGSPPRVASRGGGIYIQGSSDNPPRIINNTIVDNTAVADGDGVYTTGGCRPVLANNIIGRGGNGKGFTNDAASPAFPVLSHNGYIDTLTGVAPGPGDIYADAVFVTSPNNNDYHLSAASPCIDAGENASAWPGSFDRDGMPRIQGPRVDMGAYESPLPPPRLVFATQPGSARPGEALPRQPVVGLRDASGQTLPMVHRAVALAIKPGTGTSGATLGGTTAVYPNASNVAPFTDLSVDTEGSGYILAAAFNGMSVESQPFDIAGPKPVFTTQPGNGEPGQPLSRQPVVSFQDFGVTATDVNVPVTLAIKDGTGTTGAALLGTKTVNAVNGVATFTDIAIDRVGTRYVLTGTGAGQSVDSAAFSVVAPHLYVRSDGNDANPGTSWGAAKATVGAALAGVQPGGEVWVAAGTYTGGVTLPSGIGLYGGFAGVDEETVDERNPRQNLTVLDGGGRAVVTIASGAGRATVLDGFTLRGGTGTKQAVLQTWSYGGGVYCPSGSPTIRHNVVTGNAATFGGGLYVGSGNPLICDNIISHNTARADKTGAKPGAGGGIGFGSGATGEVYDNLVALNAAAGYAVGTSQYPSTAGGIACVQASPVLRNNTVVGNSATDRKGGFVLVGAAPRLVNNIIAGDTTGVAMDSASDPAFQSNAFYDNASGDVTGGTSPIGQGGNVQADPVFVNTAGEDYRLGTGSPCIDAGLSDGIPPGEEDLDGAARIRGASVDIGAYESLGAAYAVADAITALKIGAGLLSASGPSASPIGIEDALRILRKVCGLDPNP